jgi:hypothetical protein
MFSENTQSDKSFNGDWVVKKRIVRKKPIILEQITYSFNPIEMMKKLPTDINIYINEFLYDKNGYNEGLVKFFNREVLYDETFIKLMNKTYFNLLRKTYEDRYMNDYEYAIRKALGNDEVYLSASISFNNYESDDGRPMGMMAIDCDAGNYYIEVVDEDELMDNYENADYINNYAVLNKVDNEILFKYLYENFSSFNKDCCLEPSQIKALQNCRNNNAYEVLKSYINMVGSERQFYEWYVNYFTEDAFEMFYGDDENDDYNPMSFRTIKKIELGWKTTWIVIMT